MLIDRICYSLVSSQISHVITVGQHHANKFWVKGINILRESTMSSIMLSPLYLI